MLIKCPACHASASLPDSKQGAKVRCGECGRVFVARLPGQSLSSGPSPALIIVGAVVALGLLGVLFLGGDDDAPAPPRPSVSAAEPEFELEYELDSTGWDSAPVQAVVALHEAAFAGQRDTLRLGLHGPKRLAYLREAGRLSDAVPAGEFDALPRSTQVELLEAWALELSDGEARVLVAEGQPYDGKVVELGQRDALVRVSVTPRQKDEGFGQRWVQWRLSRDSEDSDWRAWSWESWMSRRETERRERSHPDVAKVTLSDGSVVLESEPKSLGHLDDTPEPLRTRIDELFATCTDLGLTVEASRARDELVEIGRPAIPILLNGLFETRLDTEEDAIRVNIMVTALREITGEYKGYEPQLLVGSSAGTTEERRQSAIRQWFAWWDLHQRSFVEIEEAQDGLEELIELSEEEKAWLERNPDKQ